MTLLAASALTSYIPDISAQDRGGNAARTAQQQRARKKKAKQAPKPNKKASGRKQESSAEVQKQERAAREEVAQTKAQLRENEASIKKNLSQLGKLEEDIKTTEGQIAGTVSQIGTLDKRIGGLQGEISANEKELAKMRAEYLKAVKKMRTARKNTSALAFIFASENFNQAMRRIRYLRQFSQWKDRQTAAIKGKTDQLQRQTAQLEQTRSQKNVALRSQKAAEEKLRRQHASQDAIVADLRRNGEALSAHLAKKQAEVNQLRSRVSALIAEEERAAAAERARVEAERKAAEEKRAAEERERQRREAERLEAERREKEQLLAQAEEKREQESRKAAEAKARSQEAKEPKKAEKKAEKPEKSKKEDKRVEKKTEPRIDRKVETGKKDAPKNENYADARRRRPRDRREQASAPSAASQNLAPRGDFAAMKGSLPKPAGGSFRVTSRYGRQSFPDLPDVTFDNTGIDAEVAAGASALAVYPGKVSKMVRLDGYGMVIIVNHGNYYTVYGNLASPAVKIGDMVKAGQALGSIAADEDDPSHGSIHFEVWKNKERQNPLDWIRL